MAQQPPEQHAFNWPQGTVRAILALIVVLPTILVGGYLAGLKGSEVAFTALVGFANLALGHYLSKPG